VLAGSAPRLQRVYPLFLSRPFSAGTLFPTFAELQEKEEKNSVGGEKIRRLALKKYVNTKRPFLLFTYTSLIFLHFFQNRKQKQELKSLKNVHRIPHTYSIYDGDVLNVRILFPLVQGALELLI